MAFGIISLDIVLNGFQRSLSDQDAWDVRRVPKRRAMFKRVLNQRMASQPTQYIYIHNIYMHIYIIEVWCIEYSSQTTIWYIYIHIIHVCVYIKYYSYMYIYIVCIHIYIYSTCNKPYTSNTMCIYNIMYVYCIYIPWNVLVAPSLRLRKSTIGCTCGAFLVSTIGLWFQMCFIGSSWILWFLIWYLFAPVFGTTMVMIPDDDYTLVKLNH
jgi:hypothetical protein